jgi:hypothetical protein
MRLDRVAIARGLEPHLKSVAAAGRLEDTVIDQGVRHLRIAWLWDDDVTLFTAAGATDCLSVRRSRCDQRRR